MNKGISLLLTILILGIILAITSVMALVVLQELKISSNVEESTVAFFAADTGIEYGLYLERKICRESGCPVPPCLSGCADGLDAFPPFYTASNCWTGEIDACYEIEVRKTLATTTIIIKSKGTFKGVERAIETSF